MNPVNPVNPEFASRLREALTQALATGTLDDYAVSVAAAFLVTGVLEGDIKLLAPDTCISTLGVPYWAPWTMRWVINEENAAHMEIALDNLKHLERALGISATLKHTTHEP